MSSLKERLLRFAKGLAYLGLPPPTSNFEYNRQLWNRYARFWWLSRRVLRPDHAGTTSFAHLGDEWGSIADLESILADYVHPYIGSTSKVAEVGSGGGRVASRVAPRAAEYWCMDISSAMLAKAREALAGAPNARFVLLDTPRFPAGDGTFDFVLSFDVFVHLDLHMMWKYFQEIRRVLKPGGRAFLHTSNLTAPGGWEAFAAQDSFHVQHHYFVTPETVAVLAERAQLRIVRRSAPDVRNFYLNRDYLVLLEREASSSA